MSTTTGTSLDEFDAKGTNPPTTIEPQPNPRLLVWDDFQHGFTVDSPGAKWFHFRPGPFVADDGITSTSPAGLSVISRGTNPRDDQPERGAGVTAAVRAAGSAVGRSREG